MDLSSSPPAEGVRLDGVSKVYGSGRTRVDALSDVTLDLPTGSITAVVGASGCGKSTLIRLLAGLDEPTAGTVTIHGRTPEAVRADEAVGIAFQDPALLPWRTVRGNVRLPLDLRRRKADRGRIDPLIARVGLADFARKRPRHLSGGMRQRVSIARALAVSPELLLLDEPFASLDDLTRWDLNAWLRATHAQQPATTVLVTHSVTEAVFLADQVAILTPRPGRVHNVVKVPLVGERTDDLRRSAAYSEACARVSEALTRAHSSPEASGSSSP